MSSSYPARIRRKGYLSSSILRLGIFVLVILSIAMVLYKLVIIFSFGRIEHLEPEDNTKLIIAVFAGAFTVILSSLIKELFALRMKRLEERQKEDLAIKQVKLFNLIGTDNELAVNRMRLAVEQRISELVPSNVEYPPESISDKIELVRTKEILSQELFLELRRFVDSLEETKRRRPTNEIAMEVLRVGYQVIAHLRNVI
jgi:hypothetical protein